MTHFPIPFLLSSAGYSVLLESTPRAWLDLGSSDPDQWTVRVSGTRLAYTVLVNRDPARALLYLAQQRGMPPIPPIWSFGPARAIGADETVFDMPEHIALREFGVPTTAVIETADLLPSGSHQSTTERVHSSTDLDAYGYALIGVISPHMSSTAAALEPEYSQAASDGYLVLNQSGEPYLVNLLDHPGESMALLDPTRPLALVFFQALVSELIDLGYDGFRFTHGEYVPNDAVFSSGVSGREIHNTYPGLFLEALNELRETTELTADLFVATRAGYSQVSAWVDSVWAGSQNSSFESADGLPAAVRAGLSLGLSGVPYYSSDLGGAREPNLGSLDKDLYLRWTAFSALTPTMQDTPTELAEGSDGWDIWSDNETLETYREFAALHTRLVPYLHGSAQIASETGLPLMRHLFLHYPNDENVLTIEDEYFLGPSLLVAPVLQRNALSRQVYLPDGEFYSWFGGRVLSGPRTTTV
ncbi:MAG: glycoside hydrolase family 31 protein, partial [Myxococcales bacterium]|nr:glycoside hydrolase family 31 protein [Myxococcales bacterium]